MEAMLFPSILLKDASFAFCGKPHILAVIFFSQQTYQYLITRTKISMLTGMLTHLEDVSRF